MEGNRSGAPAEAARRPTSGFRATVRRWSPVAIGLLLLPLVDAVFDKLWPERNLTEDGAVLLAEISLILVCFWLFGIAVHRYETPVARFRRRTR